MSRSICATCANADIRFCSSDGTISCTKYEPKPEMDYEELRDANTRWHQLFGTPERAARTLREFELDQLNWCHGTDGCEKCPYEFDRYGCCLPDEFSLLEWLKGGA